MIVSSHHSYIGRPSPKTFHFHYFRLRYESKGKRPRTVTRDFCQADPVAALAALRAFLVKLGSPRPASYGSSFEDMMAGPCGYAVIYDADGRMQIVREPARYRIPKGSRLYSLVGGFRIDGPEIEETDHGPASVKDGKVWSITKKTNIAIAAVDNLRLLDSRETAVFGLTIGWVLNIVGPSPKPARKRMVEFLSIYAQKKIAFWNGALSEIAVVGATKGYLN
jgi:hypothetical protein